MRENANTVLSFSLVSSPERSKTDVFENAPKSGAIEVFEYVDIIATLARRHKPSQPTMLHPSTSRLSTLRGRKREDPDIVSLQPAPASSSRLDHNLYIPTLSTRGLEYLRRRL